MLYLLIYVYVLNSWRCASVRLYPSTLCYSWNRWLRQLERILCHIGEADRPSTEYLALWMFGVQLVELFLPVAELSSDVFQNQLHGAESFWDVDSGSGTQEMPHLLRNSNVHYCVHNSPLLVAILIHNHVYFLQDLRFSQRSIWRMSSSGMWRRYVDPVWTDVPPKRRFTQDIYSSTPQKTTFFSYISVSFDIASFSTNRNIGVHLFIWYNVRGILPCKQNWLCTREGRTILNYVQRRVW
jgi:hypothetical protein